jgi:threonine dehydratase
VSAPLLALDDVRAAGRRLAGRVYRTPVIASQAFDDACGHAVFFKCENLQRAGSFKIRGALNKLLTLTEAERARGVVAFSSGNHAQGVALAARTVGTSAIICMPSDAPALKLEATRGYGAEVVLYDRQTDDREALARRIAQETGRIVVPPFDDPAIMAGQGTAALELMDDVGELDALVAPVGGGGLMAGCSTVGRALRPGLTIVGVETDTANDTYLSLRRGERVTIPPPPTIADGIRLTTPGALTFPILQRNLTDVALVSDDQVIEALRFLALRVRVVVEPTGAVSAAAVLAGKIPAKPGSRIGVILSGGNIDPAMLVSILGGGLRPPSDGRHAPGGAFLPASPQE